MAQPINCDNNCGTEAFVMWTEIGTGTVTAYCAPCLAEVCGAIAQEAGVIDALIGQKLAAMEAAGLIADPGADKPKRTRQKVAGNLPISVGSAVAEGLPVETVEETV
jgi:hypothetical protein